MDVKIETLRKLPPEHNILGTTVAQDMSRRQRMCLIVSWVERHDLFYASRRKALFDIETGEYITEY